MSAHLDVLIPRGFRCGYKARTHEDHLRRHRSKMRGHFHFVTVPRPYEERGIGTRKRTTRTKDASAVSKIANFNVRRRDWGLKRALHWEVMQALSKLGLRVHYVFVGSGMREIVGETEPVVPPGYETRVVGLDDLLPYASDPALSRAFLETAFGRGDRCTANFFNGRLVGYSFNGYVRARVNDQIDVLVPPGFRYGYKSWTHSEHRRANLSRMRGYVRRKTLPVEHEQRNISLIETHNYASLLHGYRHPRLRGLRMGFAGWITLFGRKIPFTTRRARWIGLEFVRTDDTRVRQYVW